MNYWECIYILKILDCQSSLISTHSLFNFLFVSDEKNFVESKDQSTGSSPGVSQRPTVQPYEVQGVRGTHEDREELAEIETTYTGERMTDIEEVINKEIEEQFRANGLGELWPSL